MYSTSSKLNEIILLNRKLRNALSFRGGSTRKMQDFKNKLIENKLSILYLYITCFTTILLLCYFSLPQNKKFIGGANTMYESFTDVNYHTEAKDLGNALDWIEDQGTDANRAQEMIEGFMESFRMACMKTLKEWGVKFKPGGKVNPATGRNW